MTNHSVKKVAKSKGKPKIPDPCVQFLSLEEVKMDPERTIVRWALGAFKHCTGLLEVRPTERLDQESWWVQLQAAVRDQIHVKTGSPYTGDFDCQASFDPSHTVSAEEYDAMDFRRFAELGGHFTLSPCVAIKVPSFVSPSVPSASTGTSTQAGIIFLAKYIPDFV